MLVMRSSIWANETGRPWHCLTGQHRWRHKLIQEEMDWFNYTARECALTHTHWNTCAHKEHALRMQLEQIQTINVWECTYNTQRSVKYCLLVLPIPCMRAVAGRCSLFKSWWKCEREQEFNVDVNFLVKIQCTIMVVRGEGGCVMNIGKTLWARWPS